ncbi:MAG: nuclear transport factor 2 family protein [Solirubrobacterales bacterium]|nr:nuclear transport factor 2 family protein [Solirubrobacterales bacterium]
MPENIEIVRRLCESLSRDSPDTPETLREFLDPAIEWHEDPSFSEAGVYCGIEACEEYARQFTAEFSEIHYEVRETTDAGEDLIANMLIRGRGEESGAEFELSAWWAFTIRDRKIVRCFAYLDRSRALEAIGLSE